VTEALRRQEIDSEADHAMLQLVRLESAHRLAAEAVAAGDIGAITAHLSVLDRLDRYRRGAAPVKAYDKEAREHLFAKLDSIARALARIEPKPPAADGGSPDAAVAPEPERSAALPPGFAGKSLKSLNSRKRKIWILLPLALNFLPPDLEFPSL
jgi:hypothetical protein